MRQIFNLVKILLFIIFLMTSKNIFSAEKVNKNYLIPLIIEADIISLLEDNTLQAAGNVVSMYKEYTLLSENLSLQKNEKIIQVKDAFSINYQNKYFLEGSNLIYNDTEKIGSAENIFFTYGKGKLWSKNVSMDEENLSVKNLKFTACAKNSPHYYITAKEILVKQKKKLIIKKIEFNYFNHTIFLLPEFFLKKGTEKKKAGIETIVLPTLGYDKTDGVVLETVPSFTLKKNVLLTSKIYIPFNKKTHLLNTLNYKQKNYSVNLVYGNTRERDNLKNLVSLSKLPELNFSYILNRLIPHYSQKIYLSYGNYKENKINKIKKTTAMYNLKSPEYFTDKKQSVFLNWDFSFKNIKYLHKNNYNITEGQVSINKKFKKNLWKLSYVSRKTTGNSLLQLDNIDLLNELNLSGGFFINKNLQLTTTQRYNNKEGKIFDSLYELKYYFDCHYWSLNYSAKSEKFNLGVVFFGI